MALSYNLPNDSTDIVPLNLGMYRYPKVLYSSHDNIIGQKYGDVARYFGQAERVADTSITNGKVYQINDLVLNMTIKLH